MGQLCVPLIHCLLGVQWLRRRRAAGGSGTDVAERSRRRVFPSAGLMHDVFRFGRNLSLLVSNPVSVAVLSLTANKRHHSFRVGDEGADVVAMPVKVVGLKRKAPQNVSLEGNHLIP